MTRKATTVRMPEELAETAEVVARARGVSVNVDLLDSALDAPQAGFGDEDFYPSLVEKAAVLVVRIASNHPLPDGNKRLDWQALTVFLALNGHRLEVAPDDAVALMLAIAAGDHGEAAVMAWLREHVDPPLALTQ